MKAALQHHQKQIPSASQPTKKEPTAPAARPWWAPDNPPAPAKKAEATKPVAPAMNARVVKEMQRIVKEQSK